MSMSHKSCSGAAAVVFLTTVLPIITVVLWGICEVESKDLQAIENCPVWIASNPN